MSSSGNTTGAVTGGDNRAVGRSGVADSRAEDVAQTGTCFRAGPIAFTDTGKGLVEVIEVPQLHPVGGTQAWFSGQAVYRSELLPVTDFALWAGLSEQAVKTDHLQFSSSNGRSKHRVLVVQRSLGVRENLPENASEKISASEKIGLLVSEVSGHVLIEPATQATAANSSTQAGGEAIMASLEQRLAQAGLGSDRSCVLRELIKSTWLSTEPVFVVDLQRLFDMGAFINISAQISAQDAVHDFTLQHSSEDRSDRSMEAVS